MARLQFGQSHVQIAGTTVPVAEFSLAPEDWIYFSHHVLLWTEPRTRLSFWRSSWSYRTIWVRLWGPGRVAVQSVYQPPEDTETIRRHSYATTHRW